MMKRLVQLGTLALVLLAGWPLPAVAGPAPESSGRPTRMEQRKPASWPSHDQDEPEVRRSGSARQYCILPEGPGAPLRAELRQQPLKGCPVAAGAAGDRLPAAGLSACLSPLPLACARLHLLLCIWLN